jgi:hypothetical protein
MKFASFRRICSILVAILLLAMVSSGAGLLSAWRSARSFRQLVTQNLEQARAIYELETALLEQGFSTSLYLMGGKAEWLDELRRKRPDFDAWLAKAGRMGLDRDEQELIDRIGRAFTEYDRRSKGVIAEWHCRQFSALRAHKHPAGQEENPVALGPARKSCSAWPERYHVFGLP